MTPDEATKVLEKQGFTEVTAERVSKWYRLSGLCPVTGLLSAELGELETALFLMLQRHTATMVMNTHMAARGPHPMERLGLAAAMAQQVLPDDEPVEVVTPKSKKKKDTVQ